jgi:hypothetical protein
MDPIVQTLCQAWPINVTTQQFGPTSSAAGDGAVNAAFIDAMAAVVALAEQQRKPRRLSTPDSSCARTRGEYAVVTQQNAPP